MFPPTWKGKLKWWPIMIRRLLSKRRPTFWGHNCKHVQCSESKYFQYYSKNGWSTKSLITFAFIFLHIQHPETYALIVLHPFLCKREKVNCAETASRYCKNSSTSTECDGENEYFCKNSGACIPNGKITFHLYWWKYWK